MRINGNTYTAEVTSDDRLKVQASAHNPAAIAAENQDAYTVIFEQDSGAVTSDFFYLKNTSDKNLHIYKIMMQTVTLDLDISVITGVTGSPTSGTAIVPKNMFAGGKAADVTCEGRDGDMALTYTLATDTVDRLYLHQRASGETYVGWQVWDYPATIILSRDTAMVLYVNIDPTADIDGTIYFYFG